MDRIIPPLAKIESRPGASPPDTKNQKGSENPSPDPFGSPATAQASSRPARTLPGLLAAPRCDEKGCVFPAAGPGKRKCLVHGLEEREPKHFGSFQPTMLLLDRAKYGLPDPDAEPDDSRAQDRHRLAAEREAFFEEVP
jgi:hypothetical protein